MLLSESSHLFAARKKPAPPLPGGVFLRVPGNFESVLSEGNENRGQDPPRRIANFAVAIMSFSRRTSSSELEKSCFRRFFPEGCSLACQRCSVA